MTCERVENVEFCPPDATHFGQSPARIAEVSAGQALGEIGITFCPGKYDPDSMSGFWDRDLGKDLDVIVGWGASAVLTLVEDEELKLLRVEALGEEVRRRGMLWFHLPITDVSTPDEAFELQWLTSGPEVRGMIRSQRKVLVHCRGGLGRAGMIAARLLVELGMDPGKAMQEVRAVRPGAIETCDQEEHVLSIAVTSP